MFFGRVVEDVPSPSHPEALARGLLVVHRMHHEGHLITNEVMYHVPRVDRWYPEKAAFPFYTAIHPLQAGQLVYIDGDSDGYYHAIAVIPRPEQPPESTGAIKHTAGLARGEFD